MVRPLTSSSAPGSFDRREAGGDEQPCRDPERYAPADPSADRTECGGSGQADAEGDAVDPHREPALGGPRGGAHALQAGGKEEPGGDAEQRLADQQRGIGVGDGVHDAARHTGDARAPHERHGRDPSQAGTADTDW